MIKQLKSLFWKLPLFREIKWQGELLIDVHDRMAHLENNSKQNNLLNVINSQLETSNYQIQYLKQLLNYSIDIRKIPESIGITKYIQQANLKMLLFFDKIAKEHNLNYWIDFGALIGAYRNGSFIPWDDDIDVSMPRKDYEKLKYIIEKEIKNTDFTFIRSEISRLYYGNLPVQLDIMPWDFYYKKVSDKKEKDLLSKKLIKVNQKINYDWQRLSEKKGAITNYSHKEILKLRDELILNNREVSLALKPSLFRGLECPTNSATQVRDIIDYETVFPLNTISLCKYSFPCPNEIETWLFIIYRDPFSWPSSFRKHDYLLTRIQDENDFRLLKKFISSKS